MTVRVGRGLLCLLALVIGCAKKPPEPVRVKGTVTFEGKPANGVVVTFWPEEAHRRNISALCDSAGKYSLECVSGRYKVTVAASLQGSAEPGVERGAPPAGRSYPKPALFIPDRYQSTSVTPLRVEVPAGGSDDLAVSLKN
jgi:hypothetical protein